MARPGNLKRRDSDRMNNLRELERQLRCMRHRYKKIQEQQGLAVAPSPISMHLIDYASNALRAFRIGKKKSLDAAFLDSRGRPLDPVDEDFMERIEAAIAEASCEAAKDGREHTWADVCTIYDRDRPDGETASNEGAVRKKYRKLYSRWIEPYLFAAVEEDFSRQDAADHN